MSNVKIGDYVLIQNMKDETKFKPLVGRVTYIDDANQIHGTWSGLAIIPEVDEFIILPRSRYELFKIAEESKSNLYGINFLVNYYVKSLSWTEEKAISYTIELIKNGTIKEIEILGGKQK